MSEPAIQSARRPLWLLVSMCLWQLVACEGQGGGAEEAIWRFAIEESAGSVQDAYAQRFKQLVEARSGGAVRVIVYPYGALGTSDNILEQLHNGTLDFAMSSPGHLGKLIPEMQAFLLHYTLADDERINRCMLDDGPVRAALDGLYREKGLRFLSAYSEGEMVWTTQRPVRSPADFAGMKFRVMTSPMLIAAYRAYGAHPTPLPYGEVYGALQLHMIDGQVNPVFAIEEMSFYEVTRFMVFPGHAHFVSTVAASPARLAALEPGQRAMLDGIIDELHPFVFEVQRRLNAERLAAIRERKPELQVLRLDAKQRAEFRRAAQPARAEFLRLAGPRGGQLLALLEQAMVRCGTTPAAR